MLASLTPGAQLGSSSDNTWLHRRTRRFGAARKSRARLRRWIPGMHEFLNSSAVCSDGSESGGLKCAESPGPTLALNTRVSGHRPRRTAIRQLGLRDTSGQSEAKNSAASRSAGGMEDK